MSCVSGNTSLSLWMVAVGLDIDFGSRMFSSEAEDPAPLAEGPSQVSACFQSSIGGYSGGVQARDVISYIHDLAALGFHGSKLGCKVS